MKHACKNVILHGVKVNCSLRVDSTFASWVRMVLGCNSGVLIPILPEPTAKANGDTRQKSLRPGIYCDHSRTKLTIQNWQLMHQRPSQLSAETIMDAITQTVENCSIRVDSATQRGSAIDVVRMVLGCTASAAYSYYSRLLNEDVVQNEVATLSCETSSNLSQRCEKVRINGKGKFTPVADAKTLVEIVFLLPGKTAREFRRQSAAKVCRLLGGDTTLVSEIEQRRAALESTSEGRATQSFLLAGSSDGGSATPAEIETHEGMPTGFRYLDTTDRQAVAKQVVKHELQRQQQAIKRQRCDDMFVRYKGLMNLKVELDDRTKIELRDNVSILTRQGS